MAVSCDICGVKSDTGEAFKKARNPFTLKTRVRCPACWSGEQLSFSRTLLWALGGLAVAGGFLVWARPDNNTGWFLLNIFLFGLFKMFMIIPHELGHAFVARLLGVRVFKVIVGYGRTIHTCRALGFSWEVKELPMGGLTVALSSSSRYFRLKRFLVIAAGSLVNLAVIIVSSCAARHPAMAWAANTPLAPIECLYLANMWILAVNLAPHYIVTPCGRVPSDGLALLTIPVLRREKINELLGLYYVMEGQNCRDKGDFDGAKQWYELGRSRFPENNVVLNNMGVTCIDLGQTEPARKIFLELLEKESVEPDLRPVLMN